MSFMMPVAVAVLLAGGGLAFANTTFGGGYDYTEANLACQGWPDPENAGARIQFFEMSEADWSSLPMAGVDGVSALDVRPTPFAITGQAPFTLSVDIYGQAAQGACLVVRDTLVKGSGTAQPWLDSSGGWSAFDFHSGPMGGPAHGETSGIWGGNYTYYVESSDGHARMDILIPITVTGPTSPPRAPAVIQWHQDFNVESGCELCDTQGIPGENIGARGCIGGAVLTGRECIWTAFNEDLAGSVLRTSSTGGDVDIELRATCDAAGDVNQYHWHSANPGQEEFRIPSSYACLIMWEKAESVVSVSVSDY